MDIIISTLNNEKKILKKLSYIDIPFFKYRILKLFNKLSYVDIKIIYKDVIFNDFSVELYNILNKYEIKIIKIIFIDIFDNLPDLLNDNTLVEWSIIVDINIYVPELFNKNDDGIFYDEIGKFCYLLIEYEDDDNSLTFITKYYFEWIYKQIEYYNCGDMKCDKTKIVCKEKYCKTCYNSLNDIENILIICFRHIKKENNTFIELFDASTYCKFFDIFDEKNIIKIIYD